MKDLPPQLSQPASTPSTGTVQRRLRASMRAARARGTTEATARAQAIRGSEKRDSMHHHDSNRTAQLFSAYSVSTPIRRSSPDRGRATGWRERRGVGA